MGFVAIMVDYFWNRMLFTPLDAVWGWIVVLVLSFIKALIEGKSFHLMCDPYLVLTTGFAVASTFFMVYVKKFYAKKMMEREEGMYFKAPVRDDEAYVNVDVNDD